MKKIFKLFAACALMGASLLYTSCTQDLANDIAGLGDRVAALESKVKDLQAAIDKGAVITSVDPTSNGVKVTLSNGKTFEITNGAKGDKGDKGDTGATGAAGANGANGSVVTIGPNGNWFIDGVDTGNPSQGAKGDKGDKGDQGDKGDKGDQGDKGETGDSVYFVPGADGKWEKYVNGVEVEGDWGTWLPEGTVTAVWTPQGITFYNVEGATDGQVFISLTSKLTSLAFLPDVLLQGRGVIDFTTFYKNTVQGYEPIISTPATVQYAVNPSNADLTNIEWKAFYRTVTTKSAPQEAPITVSAEMNNGCLDVTYQPVAVDFGSQKDSYLMTYWKYFFGEDNKEVLISLAAMDSEGMVLSDEAFAQQNYYLNYGIYNAAKSLNPDPFFPWSVPTKNSDFNDGEIYMANNEPINIYDYLETLCSADTDPYVFDFAKDKTLSRYEDVIPYDYYVELCDCSVGGDPMLRPYASEQEYVTFNAETGVIAVNTAKYTPVQAIGHTPIFKITLNIAGVDVKTVYTRVMIDNAGADDINVTISETHNYDTMVPSTVSKVTEHANFKAALEKLGLTAAQFAAEYQLAEVTPAIGTPERDDYVTVSNDVNTTITFVPEIVDFEGQLVLKYTTIEAGARPSIILTYNYTITHNCDAYWPAFSDSYYDTTTNTVVVKGKLMSGKWQMVSLFKEHFYKQLDNFTFKKNMLQFGFSYDKGNGNIETITYSSAEEAKNDTGSYFALDHEIDQPEIIEVTLFHTLKNGKKCTKTYNLKFVSPFTVELANVEFENKIAGKDTQNLKKKVTVKADGQVLFDGTTFKTSVGNKYGLSASDLEYAFAVDYTKADEIFRENQNITYNATNYNLSWENDGTILIKDNKAPYSVTFTIPTICKHTAEAEVIVKANN